MDFTGLPAINLLAPVAVAALLWPGYQRWLRPRWPDLDRSDRGLLLLAWLTLAMALASIPFWWWALPHSFAWPLPAFASRLLAAAALAGVVLAGQTLHQPTWGRQRLFLLLLGSCLLPLLLAIALCHRDRFQLAAVMPVAFLSVAGGQGLIAVWYLWRQPRSQPTGTETPPPLLVRYWLRRVSIFCGIWGAALFYTDSGWPPELIWRWPGDLLTSRLIASTMLALAIGAAFSRRQVDTSRVMLAVLAAYGGGVAAASLWPLGRGLPVDLPYALLFGLLGLVSALLLARQRFP